MEIQAPQSHWNGAYKTRKDAIFIKETAVAKKNKNYCNIGLIQLFGRWMSPISTCARHGPIWGFMRTILWCVPEKENCPPGLGPPLGDLSLGVNKKRRRLLSISYLFKKVLINGNGEALIFDHKQAMGIFYAPEYSQIFCEPMGESLDDAEVVLQIVGLRKRIWRAIIAIKS
jgi:hypothetical protein